MVFRIARTYTGLLLGVLMDKFDGTDEDAIKVAGEISLDMDMYYPEASSIQSIIGIMNKNGVFDRIISPNFSRIAHVNLEMKKLDYIDTIKIIEKNLLLS